MTQNTSSHSLRSVQALRERITKILGKYFPDDMDTQMYHPNQPGAEDDLIKLFSQHEQDIYEKVLGIIGEDEEGLPIDDMYRTEEELAKYYLDRKVRDTFRAELRAKLEALRKEKK